MGIFVFVVVAGVFTVGAVLGVLAFSRSENDLPDDWRKRDKK